MKKAGTSLIKNKEYPTDELEKGPFTIAPMVTQGTCPEQREGLTCRVSALCGEYKERVTVELVALTETWTSYCGTSSTD